MKWIKRISVVLLVSLASTINAQDTIRIMHYNLLNYGSYFSNCTSSNNNAGDKNDYLQTIVEYVKPDILTVNEITDEFSYHELLLDHALNVNGVTKWELGDPPNFGFAPIMNEIYYDSEKFELLSNSAIQTNYRDIDIFRFKYLGQAGGGNVNLNCVVAHLKAGNDWDDELERANETNKLMNYLNNNNAEGNYLFSGDFNVYSASENAFENLLFHPNESIRFYDPINQVGHWHNNSYYAAVHTQSTHTNGDCHSGGGMDDRFDFILISDEIRDGTDKVKYVTGSYQALGQDGLRFNQSLLFPANNSAPTEVLNALYDMSDHLPVVLDLVIGNNLGTGDDISVAFNLSFPNPVRDNLQLTFSSSNSRSVNIRLSDMTGNVWINRVLKLEESLYHEFSISGLIPGVYFLNLSNEEGYSLVRKVVVTN